MWRPDVIALFVVKDSGFRSKLHTPGNLPVPKRNRDVTRRRIIVQQLIRGVLPRSKSSVPNLIQLTVAIQAATLCFKRKSSHLNLFTI